VNAIVESIANVHNNLMKESPCLSFLDTLIRAWEVRAHTRRGGSVRKLCA